jgi:vacuolar-type H+-ATPase subunit F/Vma7
VSFHVIGAEELVIGFRFVGVAGTTVKTEAEAREFKAVTEAGSVMVLIMTEQVAAMLAREVMDWQMNGSYPLIVEIPGIEGHLESRASLLDSIREAVGLRV